MVPFFLRRRYKRGFLVSVDTLRADHLGCYGYPRDTSRFIDRLAKEATVFLNAFSPIPYTAALFPSMFASKYPSFARTGLGDVQPFVFPQEDRVFLEKLGGQGVTTAAFVSSIVVSRHNMAGVEDAFDHFDDQLPEAEINRPEVLLRRGSETVQHALQWFQAHQNEDVFLWIHLMDVHGPYVPPTEFEQEFSNDEYTLSKPLELSPVDESYSQEHIPFSEAGIPKYQILQRNGVIQKDFDAYKSRYDGNVAYVDSLLGHLLGELQNLGVLEQSLLIVHSDHGEALGENNVFFFHGLTLSLDQIHVPLIVRSPHESGGRVFAPVSLLDIVPTVLDFFGIEYAAHAYQGASLLGPQDDFSRVVLAQSPKQLTAIRYPLQFLLQHGTLNPFQQEERKIFRFHENDPQYHNFSPNQIAEEAKCISLHTSNFPAHHGRLPRFAPKLFEDMSAFIKSANEYGGQLPPLNRPPCADTEVWKRLEGLGYAHR